MLHQPQLPPTLAAMHMQRRERLARMGQLRRAVEAVSPPLPSATLRITAPVKRRLYETERRAPIYAPTYQRIIDAVAREFDVSAEAITSPSVKQPIVTARFFAVALFIETTNMSLPAIGRRLGGRDHSSILSAKRRVFAWLQEEAVRNRFDQIKAGLA